MTVHGIVIDVADDVVVARISGDVDLANTPTLAARILESVPNDSAGLVLDLSGVRYIDSVGIRMLFNFVRKLHASRQGMAIALPPESPVRKLLKITHLDEATVFRDSVGEATDAVRQIGTPQY